MSCFDSASCSGAQAPRSLITPALHPPHPPHATYDGKHRDKTQGQQRDVARATNAQRNECTHGREGGRRQQQDSY